MLARYAAKRVVVIVPDGGRLIWSSTGPIEPSRSPRHLRSPHTSAPRFWQERQAGASRTPVYRLSRAHATPRCWEVSMKTLQPSPRAGSKTRWNLTRSSMEVLQVGGRNRRCHPRHYEGDARRCVQERKRPSELYAGEREKDRTRSGREGGRQGRGAEESLWQPSATDRRMWCRCLPRACRTLQVPCAHIIHTQARTHT